MLFGKPGPSAACPAYPGLQRAPGHLLKEPEPFRGTTCRLWNCLGSLKSPTRVTREDRHMNIHNEGVCGLREATEQQTKTGGWWWAPNPPAPDPNTSRGRAVPCCRCHLASSQGFKRKEKRKGFLGLGQVETQVGAAGTSQPLAAMLRQPLPMRRADVRRYRQVERSES